MSQGTNYVLGVYEDEDVLMDAITAVRESGVKIEEVYSPFPVHGIDDVLGYKRSWLSIAAFLFGITGTCLALTMMIGMMGIDWPMIIGGKDYIPIPSFIPVTFEMTVLLASFGMVGTFFVISNLKPWGKPRIYDIRITDDKHVMAIDLDRNDKSEADIKKVLQSSGASEVNNKKFD
ncbi:quinol:cytochrome c oxidoreductase membrane protein [Ekhidna lutea]|uniref:Quinol:cytochrome c oxidoreductase membrane protein n=1 Tax=Ekhidna lutea TaxID=447679 RepID=A0A239HBY2_EKHLU|nr:DUF3341 domain-containing protein [Ekhidna lutea]SNS78887.1 quinol:cytochrome c oxidoreductase membrane protein [Ekhidna lutea]